MILWFPLYFVSAFDLDFYKNCDFLKYPCQILIDFETKFQFVLILVIFAAEMALGLTLTF